MKTLKTILLTGCLVAFNAAGVQAMQLDKVLSSSQIIANHVASNRVAPIAGRTISLDGKKYEIRFFFFEDVKGRLSLDKKFADFVRENELGSTESKVVSSGYGPIDFFTAPDSTKAGGVFYTLSLRALPKSSPAG